MLVGSGQGALEGECVVGRASQDYEFVSNLFFRSSGIEFSFAYAQTYINELP